MEQIVLLAVQTNIEVKKGNKVTLYKREDTGRL
jgi:hypothetical protein